MIVDQMTDLIGKTPMLKIPEKIHGLKNVDLYAKLEMMNPYGSVKDRTAWGMIRDDLGDIVKHKKKIFENSSGNTAKSLQAIAGPLDIEVRVVTGLMQVSAQKEMIMHLGSEIEEFAAANDCFDPSDPNDPQFLIERAVQEQPNEIYFPSQFTNQKNTEIHYKETAQEILDDLGSVDYFFSGLGTSGSTLGISRRLREVNPDLKSIGITAYKNNFIPGIRTKDQMWESGIFLQDNYDEIFTLKEKPAIEAMLKLNRKAGLLCGPSSAASYLGAVEYLKEIEDSFTERQTVVFLACDRVEWYMGYVKERMPEVYGEKPRPNSFNSFDLDDERSAPQIDIDDLEDWITAKNPMIIDVRSHIAFKLHHLEDAINIPQGLFDKLIDDADPFPKDRPILLVCAVGEKTKKHAAYMQKRGYEVYNVKDGMRGLVIMPQLMAA